MDKKFLEEKMLRDKLSAEAQRFVNSLKLPEAEKKVLDSIKEYDQNTYKHCIDVAMLTKKFMEYLHYSPDSVNTGTIAALLHDAGKIDIPSQVINKPGAFTETERILIMDHAIKAPIFMDGCSDIEALVAATHHDKYAEVDELTQIVAVCDIYSAIHLERAYKPMNPPSVAINEILKSRSLNPELLAEFETMWKKTPELVRMDDKYIAPNVAYYEQMSQYYLAEKYHISEQNMRIDHDTDFVIYGNKVIAVLKTDGTILGEPHEVELLSDEKLFERAVDWPDKDEFFPNVAEYEALLDENNKNSIER